MINSIISFILLLGLISCSQEKSNPQHLPDEYVLIEFAASLEEEYEKIYPEEKKSEEPLEETPLKNY